MDIERLVGQYYKRLCIYALHFVPDEAAAEDIVQESFVALWQNSECVRDVRAYLYAAVRNRCLNHIRRKNLVSAGDVPDDYADEDPVESSEQGARLWSALDALPGRMRQAFLLSKRDGMRYEDIALQLGISVHTVRNHIAKASRKLRRLLDDH